MAGREYDLVWTRTANVLALSCGLIIQSSLCKTNPTLLRTKNSIYENVVSVVSVTGGLPSNIKIKARGGFLIRFFLAETSPRRETAKRGEEQFERWKKGKPEKEEEEEEEEEEEKKKRQSDIYVYLGPPKAMADKETLAKARIELEELYLGIPDESVNLTFEDLAELKPITTDKSAKETATSKEPISEPKFTSSLAKLPSLDFNRGLQGVSHSQHRPYKDSDFSETPLSHAARSHGFSYIDDERHYRHMNPKVDLGLMHPMAGKEAYVDISGISMTSMQQERCVRRRPGIPHSNICTICSTYIYIFRHRCLVCGRVYCRLCVNRGMGDMTEGRKCIECLGRRFSHRYIMKAGQVGWWRWWWWCGCGYSSTVREAELEWAEKGPRKRGEKGNGRGSTIMLSTMSSHATPTMPSWSRSSMTPRTPTQSTTPLHSFSSYSPYSPTHRHQLPF